jgi:UDP-glucose 6-dehydrogenase
MDEGGGFGGDCLPKDTLALVAELNRLGIGYELLAAVLRDNERLRS